MDPAECLRLAQSALNKGDLDAVRSYIGAYNQWRSVGGFEPAGGDKRRDALERVVANAAKWAVANAAKPVDETRRHMFARDMKDERDSIMYVVVVQPGGVDGLSKEPGGPKFASFNKVEAMKHCDAWSKIELRIIENVDKARKQALSSLDPVTRALLDLNNFDQKGKR